MEFDKDKFEEEVIGLSQFLYFQYSHGEAKFSLPSGLKKNNSDDKNNFSDLIFKAKEILKNEVFIKHLCPALKSVKTDLQEIAKIVVGVMLPLSLLPNSNLPVDSLLYSGIVLVIFNAGISFICPS